MLEIPAVRDPVPLLGPAAGVGSEHPRQLVGFPHEERSLLPLAIRILSAGEASFGCHHFAQHPLATLAGNACEAFLSRNQVGLEVRGNQERVVVQHLLEVRDQPALVRAVAVKTAPELVVDTPAGHLVQGKRHLVQRILGTGPQVMTQHDAQVPRVWKFGRLAEPTPHDVVVLAQHLEGVVQATRVDLGVAICAALARDLLGQSFSLLLDLALVGGPGPGEVSQHVRESRPAMGAERREIRAPKEGPAVGRQKNTHGPAPGPGHPLHGLHVDLIQVRTFFPVDFDVDEVLVHQRRHLFALEGLVLHHVAPVAR